MGSYHVAYTEIVYHFHARKCWLNCSIGKKGKPRKVYIYTFLDFPFFPIELVAIAIATIFSILKIVAIATHN